MEDRCQREHFEVEGKPTSEERRWVGCKIQKTSSSDISIFISLSLEKHHDAVKGQRDQTATTGTHFAPDAKSPLGTGQTLPVGAQIIIIKFVEPFSVPGTVLSDDICNNHPV